MEIWKIYFSKSILKLYLNVFLVHINIFDITSNFTGKLCIHKCFWSAYVQNGVIKFGIEMRC